MERRATPLSIYDPGMAAGKSDDGHGLPARLAGKRVIVTLGAGGVGKTTTSAALALGLAMRGSKVAVVTIDPARRLASALGLDELSGEPHRIDDASLRAARPRAEGRAVGDDARHEGDVRRGRRGISRPTRPRARRSSRTRSTASSRRRSRARRS